MAKKSMEQRELKRTRLVAKYASKRAALKGIIHSPTTSQEERWEAQVKLQRLPRDSSPARGRNRCGLTGRPHGYYRQFGLGRTALRRNVMNGRVTGVRKASW